MNFPLFDFEKVCSPHTYLTPSPHLTAISEPFILYFCMLRYLLRTPEKGKSCEIEPWTDRGIYTRLIFTDNLLEKCFVDMKKLLKKKTITPFISCTCWKIVYERYLAKFLLISQHYNLIFQSFLFFNMFQSIFKLFMAEVLDHYTLFQFF